MDSVEKYKDSGILELYVYGLLSEEESIEVTQAIQKHPELKTEVEEIEKALIKLSADYYPKDISSLRPNVTNKKKSNNLSTLFAWVGSAAAILLLVVSGYLYFNNQGLQSEITNLEQENKQLEDQIINARNDIAETRVLLDSLRSRNITRVALNAQEVDPDAFAVGYYSDDGNRLILDAKDLPEPPEGMVYQVWALEFEPLTPSSLGLLDNFKENEEGIFYLEVDADTQGFGITLEPEGGSETPTLERLYVLGQINA